MGNKMTIGRLKTWLQHRIDYWEDVCEEPSCGNPFDDGEHEGMRAAFNQVMEFLQGQRV